MHSEKKTKQILFIDFLIGELEYLKSHIDDPDILNKISLKLGHTSIHGGNMFTNVTLLQLHKFLLETPWVELLNGDKHPYMRLVLNYIRTRFNMRVVYKVYNTHDVRWELNTNDIRRISNVMTELQNKLSKLNTNDSTAYLMTIEPITSEIKLYENNQRLH